MKRNRYILCLLFGGFLLYYAVQRFSIFAQGAEGIFTISWLILAMFVIAGNLTSILYSPKRKKPKDKGRKSEKGVQYGG